MITIFSKYRHYFICILFIPLMALAFASCGSSGSEEDVEEVSSKSKSKDKNKDDEDEDEENYLKSQKVYTDSDADGVPDAIKKYYYNKSGSITKEEHYNNADDEVDTTYEYYRDDFGYSKKILIQEDGTPNIEHDIENSYNSDGLIESRIYYVDDELVKTKRYSYDYDAISELYVVTRAILNSDDKLSEYTVVHSSSDRYVFGLDIYYPFYVESIEYRYDFELVGGQLVMSYLSFEYDSHGKPFAITKKKAVVLDVVDEKTPWETINFEDLRIYGTVTEYQMEFVTAYDDEGNVLTRSKDTYDDGSINYFTYVENTYKDDDEDSSFSDEDSDGFPEGIDCDDDDEDVGLEC
jgi:hypothetical protein